MTKLEIEKGPVRRYLKFVLAALPLLMAACSGDSVIAPEVSKQHQMVIETGAELRGGLNQRIGADNRAPAQNAPTLGKSRYAVAVN